MPRVRKPRLTPEERETRRQEIEEYHRQYRQTNKELLTHRKREYMNRVRLEGLAVYGGKCACCGEDEQMFLTIDHIEGRDERDYRSSGRKLTGKRAWANLKSLGWPKDRIQLLCFNCNCAKGAYGICPHQKQ